MQKILIVAGDTDGNLGDFAIVMALCKQIQAVNPGMQISLVTSRPTRDRNDLGIHPIPRGIRGLAPLLRAAAEADLVICGGGGLFQDDDSLIKMPYWALRLLLLRTFCRRISGLSIGAGPLNYRVSRFFARIALRQMERISVRDSLAQAVLQPLTKTPVQLVADPAFLLAPATLTRAQEALQAAGIPTDGKPIIGVALRRWFHKSSSLIPYKYASLLGLQKSLGQEEMSTLTRLVARVLDDVVGQTGSFVVFMPTYDVAHEADIEVCRAVALQMRSNRTALLQLDDPGVYKAVSSLLNVMLCGRMHAGILAAGERTPVVGLAYNPKFFGMFSLIGQPDSCLSIQEFVETESTDNLTTLLIAAIQEPSGRRPDTTPLARGTREYIKSLVAETASTNEVD